MTGPLLDKLLDAIAYPFLTCTTGRHAQYANGAFGYTSFLRFALWWQRCHKLLDDGGGHLRRSDVL